MKRKNLKPALILSLALMLSGCGSSSSGTGSYADTSSARATAESAYDSGYYEDYDYAAEEYDEGFSSSESGDVEDVEVTEGAQSDRKLIRTVNLEVETYDFDAMTESISSRVSALGGYVESSSVDGNTKSSSRYASYTLRIPAGAADSFMEELGNSSNVTHKSENMEDVTLQYVDVNSRKESLKVEYARLEELLKEAADVEELIYIESRMSDVRYEIESIESQLRSYDNKVDYTTIYLNVEEVQVYTEPEPVDNSVGARVARGWKTALDNILQFLQDLVVVTAVSIPYLLLIALLVLAVVLIIWLIRKLIKRIGPSKKKNVNRTPFPGQPYAQPYGQPYGQPAAGPGMPVRPAAPGMPAPQEQPESQERPVPQEQPVPQDRPALQEQPVPHQEKNE